MRFVSCFYFVGVLRFRIEARIGIDSSRLPSAVVCRIRDIVEVVFDSAFVGCRRSGHRDRLLYRPLLHLVLGIGTDYRKDRRGLWKAGQGKADQGKAGQGKPGQDQLQDGWPGGGYKHFFGSGQQHRW